MPLSSQSSFHDIWSICLVGVTSLGVANACRQSCTEKFNIAGKSVQNDCQSNVQLSDAIGFVVLGCGVATLLGFILFIVATSVRRYLPQLPKRRKPRRRPSRSDSSRLELTNVPVYDRRTNDYYIPPSSQQRGDESQGTSKRAQSSGVRTARNRVGDKDQQRRAKSKNRPLRSDIIDYAIIKKGGQARRGQHQSGSNDGDSRGAQRWETHEDPSMLPPFIVNVEGRYGTEKYGTAQHPEELANRIEDDVLLEQEIEDTQAQEDSDEFDAGAPGEESAEFFRGADEPVVGGGFDEEENYPDSHNQPDQAFEVPEEY